MLAHVLRPLFALGRYCIAGEVTDEMHTMAGQTNGELETNSTKTQIALRLMSKTSYTSDVRTLANCIRDAVANGNANCDATTSNVLSSSLAPSTVAVNVSYRGASARDKWKLRPM